MVGQRVDSLHPTQEVDGEIATSPLSATIGRVLATFSHVQVHYGTLPAGWSRSIDVVNDPEAVRALLDETCQLFAIDDRQVAASFLVLGYMWQMMVATMACYLLDRRVPDLSAGVVSVHPASGVTFLSDRVTALADDLDVSHPSVAAVGTIQQLRSALVEQVEREHMTPLFATLRSVAPLGVNAMRANAVDRVASAIIWLAEQLGEPELARREVPLFAQLMQSKPRTGIIEIEHNGQSRIFLRRAGCCLNYRVRDNGTCDTCCLLREDERLGRLRHYVMNGP